MDWPIPEDDMLMARNVTMIRFANALLDCRLGALREGLTDEILAKRLGWTVKRWREALTRPNNLSLDMVSDIALACGCEITITAVRCSPLPAPPVAPEANVSAQEGDKQ